MFYKLSENRSRDGDLLGHEELMVPVSSGFAQHGLGAFATVRTYSNSKEAQIPFRLDLHLQRFQRSARMMNCAVADEDADEMAALILRVCAEAQNILRMKILTGAGLGDVFLQVAELKEMPEVYKGVKLKTVPGFQRTQPKAKSTSYVASRLSHDAAVNDGFYDAILVSESGEVLEGAYCNLFWLKDGVLFTREEGVLEGVTRETVMEIAENLGEIEFRFGQVNVEGILEADEVFLTQTSKGIVPVTEIDGEKIADGEVGDLTKLLMEGFADYVEQYVEGA